MHQRHHPRSITRREWLATAGGALLSTTAACRVITGPHDYGSAHLTVTPTSPITPIGPGTYKLNLGAKRDGALYVPPSYTPGVAMPLMVMLHGAAGGVYTIGDLPEAAAEAGVLLLAPESRDMTWGMEIPGFDTDSKYLGMAFRWVSDVLTIDRTRMAIGGVSDGANYALNMGLAYGDSFNHLMIFSVGMLQPFRRQGTPTIFLAHGIKDEQMPIDRTARKFVPQLREEGYDVTYVEYDGGHGAPLPVVRESFEWLMQKKG